MSTTKLGDARSSGDEFGRWWRQHSELDQLVEALIEATARPSVAAAREAVGELADALEGHFAVEEDVYFPLVERLRPEYAATLGKARLAHLEVREQLGRVRADLEKGNRLGARDVLIGLLDTFRAHEELERNLIAGLRAGHLG